MMAALPPSRSASGCLAELACHTRAVIGLRESLPRHRVHRADANTFRASYASTKVIPRFFTEFGTPEHEVFEESSRLTVRSLFRFENLLQLSIEQPMVANEVGSNFDGP